MEGVELNDASDLISNTIYCAGKEEISWGAGGEREEGATDREGEGEGGEEEKMEEGITKETIQAISRR